MKIYIASKFEDRAKVVELYEKIEELGHEVSYDWTKHKPIKPYSENKELAIDYCDNELMAIPECDVFIGIFNNGGTTLLMEFGAALTLAKKFGKPIVYSIGDIGQSPWFFHPLVKRRNSVDEVLKEITDM